MANNGPSPQEEDPFAKYANYVNEGPAKNFQGDLTTAFLEVIDGIDKPVYSVSVRDSDGENLTEDPDYLPSPFEALAQISIDHELDEEGLIAEEVQAEEPDPEIEELNDLELAAAALEFLETDDPDELDVLYAALSDMAKSYERPLEDILQEIRDEYPGLESPPES